MLDRARAGIGSLEVDREPTHERLIDSLIEHMYNGFVLLDPEGVHLDVNPAFCAMTGFTHDELIGGGLPHPYWPPEARHEIARVLSHNLEGPTGPSEVTFMRRTGERFPVVITPTLMRDEAAQPVCVFAIVRDVSEQRRAEKALQESEARYRTVFENAPVGIFQSTPEGQFVLLNPACAEAFGCETPAETIEAINRVGIEQALYEDPDDRRRLMQGVRDGAGAWIALKTRLRHGDGTFHVAVIYACERPDPATGQANLFGFVQDVTAQEQAKTTLEHAASLLSHGERLAHVGSWEWDVVAGMCSVSAEWQRMHGLAGDVFSDDEVNATCHEDDRSAIQAALARARAGRPYRVAHRIVHPMTHEVRHVMTYGDPIRDAEGRLERVIGASLDVTERVRADEALREREERLRRALGATVAALGATVTMRDPYTADHQSRVALLAGMISERLGWSAEVTDRVRTAALVHDIGKISLPAEILSKPTRLTETEFALIKAHSAAAYEILAPIEFDGPVAEIVYQHHERLDGSGYPRGLRGDEILPGARVLAIADVVEAMITHRPYRAALTLEAALAEIGPDSRGRFDPEAAEVCRRLFEDEGFELPD